MDEIAPWLTPALIIALFTWLQRDMRELRREENRERMAKLEGSLEGFLAGRRDRDAA